ncbi:MAG: ABC transporter substrate-binding protein, partial [bacterium]|nr:ABC transporter substrate-binding protein [bacterium]
PRRGNWDGVSVEKVDERTIVFHLKSSYAPFMENLTLGILPKHIWKNVSEDEFAFSQFNTLPVGSGPYEIAKVERNSGGIPNYYVLEPFNKSRNGPHIGKLVFKFYPGEDALISAYEKKEINSLASISPDKAASLEKSGARILTSPLPRVFGVFFNQNQSKVLLNKPVRQALDLAAPKESIVDTVLGGYATVIDGPLPPGLYEWSSKRSSELSYEERFQSAAELLKNDGWERNPQTGTLEKKSKSGNMELSFSISTGDAPELKAVANELIQAWQALGARVELLVFESGDLNQNVIRPRRFDALLFGEVVGRETDVYPFWHSSQRNDPGLNIALYANARADKALEEARASSDTDIREKNHKIFDEEFREDLPAIFLYSPSFLYAIPEKVKDVELSGLSTPQDRFLSIRDWYIETDKIWKIFN